MSGGEEEDEDTETEAGGTGWMLGASSAGMLDAGVFAYTHLILSLPWSGARGKRLQRLLAQFPGLIAHERRIREICFPEK